MSSTVSRSHGANMFFLKKSVNDVDTKEDSGQAILESDFLTKLQQKTRRGFTKPKHPEHVKRNPNYGIFLDLQKGQTIMAQDPKIESIGSIILAILEVQVVPSLVFGQ